MKRTISMILCLVIALVSITGCTTLEGDDKGAIVNMYLAGRIFDFDPAMNLHNSDMLMFFDLIYEGLTDLNSDGDWTKALMKSYKKDYNDETGEYKVTITLNRTQWSDGRNVQAQDVVFAWKRILEPTFECSAASMLYDIKNAREVKRGDCSIDDLGVIAVDTYVVEVSFNYAVDLDAFFRTCASPALVPLREDVVARKADWATKTSSMVTNGPFAVKRLDHHKENLIRLERNVNYYLDDEKEEALDKYVIPWRIEVRYGLDLKRPTRLSSLEDQLAAYESGRLHYIGDLPLASRADYANKVTIHDEMSTHSYLFNTKNELFADPDVRLALSMAIDRNEIVKILTFAKPATGLIPYGVDDGGSKDDFREVGDASGVLVKSEADLSAAKDLLKKAGVRGGEFTLTVRENDEADLAVAKYVAGVWDDLGFDVKVELVDVEVITEEESAATTVVDHFGNKLRNGEFDVIAIDMQMLNADAFSALSVYADQFSGGGVDMDSPTYDFIPHISGYVSKAYNEIIEKAYAEHDAAARATILHEAEALLMKDMPIIPLVFNQDFYMIDSGLLSGYKTTFWATKDFTRMKMKNYMKEKEAILATEIPQY